ncbi:invasion associated locus B family protein [Telmatospirillum sp. J64-1]|uniref:invasion associated locus B family protein n=1 Tax=Telmatospirillum sp. J64-1 TaxID=2502183 RepID=UPI00115C96FD|nr:invasion associated locus B family protein [Telmatospirillum sp. J64-1]
MLGTRRLPILAAMAASILAAAPALLASSPAEAQATAQSLGRNGAWEGYVFEAEDGKVCYMASRPSKSQGSVSDRGPVYVAVTHRPGNDSRDVISINAGYPFAEGSEVLVKLDGKDYTLFTRDDTAWTYRSEDDAELTKEMIRGRVMEVRGKPANGEETLDSFSLMGFTATYRAISQACNIR